jgi:hypothetical protein
MKRLAFMTLLGAAAAAAAGTLVADDATGWHSLFDGKTLEGWKSNDEVPGVFTVENGAIKVKGGRAHLFYAGKVQDAKFRNFEFKAKVMTKKKPRRRVWHQWLRHSPPFLEVHLPLLFVSDLWMRIWVRC